MDASRHRPWTNTNMSNMMKQNISYHKYVHMWNWLRAPCKKFNCSNKDSLNRSSLDSLLFANPGILMGPYRTWLNIRNPSCCWCKVFTCTWWMGHYLSCTPKQHVCWANCKRIGGLDRGPLTREQRAEIRKTGVKSATVTVNKKGKKVYTGTSKLRGTG